jgi:hypothetical protein
MRLGVPGLDDVEKRKILPLKRFEIRSLGRPARSQSLYRERYPGSRRKGEQGENNYTMKRFITYAIARYCL